MTDHFATNDEHALEITRRIIDNLNLRKTPSATLRDPVEPLYDIGEILGIIPKESKQQFDIREVAPYSEFEILIARLLRAWLMAQYLTNSRRCMELPL